MGKKTIKCGGSQIHQGVQKITNLLFLNLLWRRELLCCVKTNIQVSDDFSRFSRKIEKASEAAFDGIDLPDVGTQTHSEMECRLPLVSNSLPIEMARLAKQLDTPFAQNAAAMLRVGQELLWKRYARLSLFAFPKTRTRRFADSIGNYLPIMTFKIKSSGARADGRRHSHRYFAILWQGSDGLAVSFPQILAEIDAESNSHFTDESVVHIQKLFKSLPLEHRNTGKGLVKAASRCGQRDLVRRFGSFQRDEIAFRIMTVEAAESMMNTGVVNAEYVRSLEELKTQQPMLYEQMVSKNSVIQQFYEPYTDEQAKFIINRMAACTDISDVNCLIDAVDEKLREDPLEFHRFCTQLTSSKPWAAVPALWKESMRLSMSECLTFADLKERKDLQPEESSRKQLLVSLWWST